jgi:lipopolysaccharide biosynthesis glycosyltransferase
MLTIAIGYDHRESIAFYVLAHSIMRRASGPVKIVPLALNNLKHLHARPRSPNQSTDFTFTRFLTPSLADFNQTSIFLDCDMLCLADIYELAHLAQNQKYSDVLCVQHDYTPVDEIKFLNQTQTTYPCKNWSSVMVFNGHRMACKRLTPDYVDKASAMDLHQFKWADEVGSLPREWNHLVGEYPANPAAKIVHWTNGGPWFKNYLNTEYADAWFYELRDMLHRDNPSFDLNREPL